MPGATQHDDQVEVPAIIRALEPEVVEVLWKTVEPLLPRPARQRTRWAVTGRGSRTGCASGGSWSGSSPARRGSTSKRSSSTRCPTRRCGPGATSGSPPACSTASRPKRPPRSTGSSSSTSPRSPSTGHSTRPPTAAKGPARTPLTVGKLGWKWSVASERTASRRLGDRRRQPQRRPHARTHPRRRRRQPGCSPTSSTLHLDRGYDYPVVRERLAGYGLTDLDIQRRGTKQPGKTSPSGSGCAGSSKPPTPGGRTTANSAATPTAATGTDTPPSASPPPSSSSADSSTTATDGAHPERLSAQVLSLPSRKEPLDPVDPLRERRTFPPAGIAISAGCRPGRRRDGGRRPTG